MMLSSHIIKQQSIEVSFDDLNGSFGIQNRIAEVFYEKVQPRMEVLFDELFGDNYQVSIDRLEIDCGILNKNNWEDEFTAQAMRKLKEQLVQVNKKQTDSNKWTEITAGETFFFFLENGFLPWNTRIHSITALEEISYIDKELLKQLKKLILRNRVVAERLASQFSEKFTAGIISTFAEDSGLLEPFSLVRESALYQVNKRLLTTELLKALAVEMPDAIGTVLKNIKKKEDVQSAVEDLIEIIKKRETPGFNEEAKPSQPGEAIYINNAGLVLLHPFLQTLFDALQLTRENVWIDEAAKHKAIVILEFLTTGRNEYEEFDLVLNKVLCDVEIDEVIITQHLNKEIIDECELLLKSVITHWSALKNTGPGGLREAFLQRRGKLSKVGNGWLLQVEQKAIDVLLGHLPWGIGFVKLSWMSEPLLTEWL